MDTETQIEESTHVLEENQSEHEDESSITNYQPPCEETSSTSEIVENLRVPLSIELSRLKYSIQQLGSLTSGQVLELNKKPGDLVDLVVSGKMIGQGELVDIEGELGVRIVSLVK